MESNELNKLVNKTETEAWIVAQTDSSQRESETGGWMKEGEGIKQNTHTHHITCMDTDNNGLIARGKWGQG